MLFRSHTEPGATEAEAAALVAQRMMGYTDARQAPTAERLQAVLAPEVLRIYRA